MINGEFIFFLNFLLGDAKVYKLIRYPGKMSYDQSRQLRSNTALGNLDHIIQTVTSGVIQYVEDRLGISQNYLGIAFHTASSALMASYAFLISDPEINTKYFAIGMAIHEAARTSNLSLPTFGNNTPLNQRRVRNILAAMYAGSLTGTVGGLGTLAYGVINQDPEALDLGAKLTTFFSGMSLLLQASRIDSIRVLRD